ncbi:MAG: (2Fe-2S)-binding protein [Pseudomonadales bacterium]|nr:(2Fe-2S)-binding protein [Pseudomonadales bacterium]
MYICICKAVTDRQLKSAIENGTTDLKSLCKNLGLGTGCGRCLEQTKTIIKAHNPMRSGHAGTI